MTSQVLLDELLMEILSYVPVKSLLQFMCVSKQFQSIIYDPRFVKLHLQRSPKGSKVLVTLKDPNHAAFLFSLPIGSLLESSSFDIAYDDLNLGFDLHDDSKDSFDLTNKFLFHSSCNGLVFLSACDRKNNGDLEVKFTLWNPATRKIYADPKCILLLLAGYNGGTVDLGYHNLTDTYKLVSIHLPTRSSESYEVRVCSISTCDNNSWSWRKIQSFPAELIRQVYGKNLNNTFNWIAHESRYNDELLIVSLDLGKETYTKILLPHGLDGILKGDFVFPRHHIVACNHLKLEVLNDCLSVFFQNPRTNHFALWQMKEFGNQNSWTLLLNVSLQDLHIDSRVCFLNPLRMLETGSVLMIHKTYRNSMNVSDRARWRAILYNGRDKIVKHVEMSGNIGWIHCEDYVESLVLLGRSY